MLPTMMKTLMTVEFLRKMNHYSHRMWWGLRISWSRSLGLRWWWGVAMCAQCWSNVAGCWVSTSVHTFWISDAEAVHWWFIETPLSWLPELLSFLVI
jgi:hypothetical protein